MLSYGYIDDQQGFLAKFWRELIEANKGKVCYFHNFGGYDSILSLPSLLIVCLIFPLFQ